MHFNSNFIFIAEIYSGNRGSVVAIGEYNHHALLQNRIVPFQLQYALKIPPESIDNLASKAFPFHPPPDMGPIYPGVHHPATVGGHLAQVPIVKDPDNPPFALFWYLPLHPILEIDTSQKNPHHNDPDEDEQLIYEPFYEPGIKYVQLRRKQVNHNKYNEINRQEDLLVI